MEIIGHRQLLRRQIICRLSMVPIKDLYPSHHFSNTTTNNNNNNRLTCTSLVLLLLLPAVPIGNQFLLHEGQVCFLLLLSIYFYC